MTYRVLNYEDKKNTDLAMKFEVVTSSFCIDRIVKGQHNRINVMDIWYWDCRGKPEYYDQKIKDLIKLAIK
jgi:hypothetical protein